MIRPLTLLLLLTLTSPALAGEQGPLHLDVGNHFDRQRVWEQAGPADLELNRQRRLRATSKLTLRTQREWQVDPRTWTARPFVTSLRRSEDDTRIVVGLKVKGQF